MRRSVPSVRPRGQGIRRIAINTGGGDAPGLNAVIRAIVISAADRGIECIGIRDGYTGLLDPKSYPQGGLVRLTRDSVRGITHLGGTILRTTNLGNPLSVPGRRGCPSNELPGTGEAQLPAGRGEDSCPYAIPFRSKNS